MGEKKVSQLLEGEEKKCKIGGEECERRMGERKVRQGLGGEKKEV